MQYSSWIGKALVSVNGRPMLDRKQEYERMAKVEEVHWWYKALHHLVLDSIGRHFPVREIEIIDAGCGTGGLMLFLRKHGYANLKGFDISTYAVDICRQRQLDVEQYDLLDIAHRFPETSTDVIVSNDTLYFLDDQERIDLMGSTSKVLRPGGLFILNLPALQPFRGIHDLSVGVKHRFAKQEVYRLFDPSQFQIVRSIYWPSLLSPGIYIVRLVQRIKMRMNPSFDLRSDIDLPKHWVNLLLTGITRFENRWVPTKPFGSSLFLVAKRR